MINKIVPVFFCLILTFDVLVAHDPHSDPELAELNDYMMAIQVLRHSEDEAENLFRQWQELRLESWRIREMTDDEDLDIDHPKVVEQIEITTRLRKQLLRNSREYFSLMMDRVPSVRVQLGDDISITEINTFIQAPVGSRRVVPVEFTTSRSQHSHLFLRETESDEILFWSKEILVSGARPRYTFVYVSPLSEGINQATIHIFEDDETVASFTVQGEGTLPATYEWYNHIPAVSPTDILHGEYSEPDFFIEPGEKAIRFDIRDPETGKPMPVRVEVKDQDGNAYWTPLKGPFVSVERERAGWQTPLWTFQTGPYFYIDGEATLGVDPQGKTARIYHGFEYKPAVIDLPEDGFVTSAPERWINMRDRGWYSGHTHIHTTDIGIPVQYSRFWPLVTRGEGLGVSAILTLQGERVDHAIYSDEYPMGPLKSHSTEEHLITYGEEYRNNPYGHLALLGLDYLILPLSSGSLGEVGGPDYPPNQFVLKEAVSQGGVTIGAHFGSSITDDDPIRSSWPSTGFEMPVNVALGYMHLAEIYGNAGHLDIWYKLLNSGFNIFATSGPDWSMKDTPRAYVYLGDQEFNVENWLESLKKGRSFITHGPMLFFTVDGQLAGSKYTVPDGPHTMKVNATALNPDGNQKVEIIVNGIVAASGYEIEQTIIVDDSSWIAARTESAHSNPVFINFDNRPRGYAEEAEIFIRVIDRLEEWVETKALFDNPAQKAEVLKVLDEGRSMYIKIVERAGMLERTSPYLKH
jgi:hypothetical protein